MCNRPNYMVWLGDYTENKKVKLIFAGHKKYESMIKSNVPFIQVPCGQCLECRLQQTRQWADRCVLEAKKYKDNYFITLTYDDDHLPQKNSLNPDDVVRFIKRLRRKFPDNKIRVFYCGEYGDQSMRPHYHLLVFNCPLNDLSDVFQMYDADQGRYVNYLRPYASNENLRYSRTIYDLWKDKKTGHLGLISVGAFNYDTAAYVSQYVQKKSNPKMKKIYKDLGIYPEFARMSNRPGIGADYFEDNDNGVYSTHIIVPSPGEAHKAAIPRYFDKLFIQKYGEDVFLPIRAKRLKKRFQNYVNVLNSDFDFEQQCEINEYNLKKKKILRSQI